MAFSGATPIERSPSAAQTGSPLHRTWMIWPTNGSSRRNAARDLPFRYSFCGGHGGIGQSMTTQRGFSSAIVLMDESGDLVI